MKKSIILLGIIAFLFSCQTSKIQTETSSHDLDFEKLAKSWDEAIPLGNGMVGALVWQKGDRLRLSLDRANLWDLRPMQNLDLPEWKFKWVYEQWKKDNYGAVQQNFDAPYDRNPAPSKIPAAALEFDISKLGEVSSVNLHLQQAICEVNWENGAYMQTFVHATEPVGWFRFEGVDKDLIPDIIAPDYNLSGEAGEESPVTGQDLRRLKYSKGSIDKQAKSITYEQEGWGGFKYQVNVRWRESDDLIEGCWSISSEIPEWEKQMKAENRTGVLMKDGYNRQLKSHQEWWNNFWAQSNISLPDTLLEKQWYLEQYKFGSAARQGAPPISLQAVWTADNGKLPPWKGDFHHDLNTQLSYWPAYSSNHLEEEEGFVDWLWKYKSTFEKYTKDYYETNGLNVPGVSTLTGQPMGGWIQYSFGPTVSAWLAQHFYLHWRYSMDYKFLKEKAYPWIKGVAIHLDELSVIDKNGKRKLPLSSSPEIFDNSRKAWFSEMTNFDLSLIRWTFEKSAELALELGKNDEAAKWEKVLSEWPDFIVDKETGFMFASGFPYEASHRHFSHLMAYHPLGLVDYSNGKDDQQLINNTIANLDKYGSDWWTGYSFSWLGNLKARAFDGEGAAKALKTFATCFCLPNSFHVNGDQSGTGKSKFTYRPFTLEGNFAYASGIQEMLIQSHTGIVRIFPAIPKDWKDVSFEKLRTEGAFLISAKMENGITSEILIQCENGGILSLANPFTGDFTIDGGEYILENNIIKIDTQKDQLITLIRDIP